MTVIETPAYRVEFSHLIAHAFFSVLLLRPFGNSMMDSYVANVRKIITLAVLI